MSYLVGTISEIPRPIIGKILAFGRGMSPFSSIVRGQSLDSKLQNFPSKTKKAVSWTTCFDTLSCLDADRKCERHTDEWQTEVRSPWYASKRRTSKTYVI